MNGTAIVASKGREGGFTLVEVLIAIVILGIGIMGYLGMQYQSIHAREFVKSVTRAIVAESSVVEEKLGQPPIEDEDPDTYYDEDDWRTYAVQFHVHPLPFSSNPDSEVSKKMKVIASNTSWEDRDSDKSTQGYLVTFYPYGNR